MRGRFAFSTRAVRLGGKRQWLPSVGEEATMNLDLDRTRRAHDDKAYAYDYVVRHAAMA